MNNVFQDYPELILLIVVLPAVAAIIASLIDHYHKPHP